MELFCRPEKTSEEALSFFLFLPQSSSARPHLSKSLTKPTPPRTKGRKEKTFFATCAITHSDVLLLPFASCASCANFPASISLFLLPYLRSCKFPAEEKSPVRGLE